MPVTNSRPHRGRATTAAIRTRRARRVRIVCAVVIASLLLGVVR